MKKLNKENIYINLQGKSKEELTDLYWVLKNNNEGFVFIKELNEFLITPSINNNDYLVLSEISGLWVHSDRERETEVTIQELKEILQPMDNKEFDLSMCRVQVDNEEQAKKLQELAFKQGFKWSSDSKKLQYLHRKVFYFDTRDYAITHSELNHTDSFFKEINFNDIFKQTLEQQEINNIEVDFENVEVNQKSIFGITPDKVVQLVMNDLNERSLKGIEKYNTTLERLDLSLKDWLKHAYEETLDKANYLKRAIIELDKNK